MLNRREVLRTAPALLLRGRPRRPNILFAIADDQSWLHTSAAGDAVVKTPAIDRIARTGVLFSNAVCASPGCAPSRAAVLTGRVPWQLEEAGTHASFFPKKFTVYPDLLEAAGYHTGLTAKGAGPCNFKGAGWAHNPAGKAWDSRTAERANKGLSNNDYAANFADFIEAKPKTAPFCFWFGCHEPHRVYAPGAGLASGKRLTDVTVPPFLPDAPEVRSDILDYYAEIEHFDRHLGRMLELLERRGELEQTLVVATADNGMSFPGSKAQMHEYGIHMPLAVAWPAAAPGGRRVDDLISFTDFAPTFLEAAGLPVPRVMTGRSFLDVLTSGRSGRVDAQRTWAVSGRERHSHARFDNLGYPTRALRTHEFLYIRNFKPERWPAGDPDRFADIDDGPSKTFMLANRERKDVKPLFEAAFGKHPAEELYDIRTDPGCLRNLAEAQPAVLTRMRTQLESTLTAQRDPRMLGTGDVFESYPRFSPMRPELGGFAEQGQYNPKYQR
jgi:uncharacterized sulfatase